MIYSKYCFCRVCFFTMPPRQTGRGRGGQRGGVRRSARLAVVRLSQLASPYLNMLAGHRGLTPRGLIAHAILSNYVGANIAFGRSITHEVRFFNFQIIRNQPGRNRRQQPRYNPLNQQSRALRLLAPAQQPGYALPPQPVLNFEPPFINGQPPPADLGEVPYIKTGIPCPLEDLANCSVVVITGGDHQTNQHARELEVQAMLPRLAKHPDEFFIYSGRDLFTVSKRKLVAASAYFEFIFVVSGKFGESSNVSWKHVIFFIFQTVFQ